MKNTFNYECKCTLFLPYEVQQSINVCQGDNIVDSILYDTEKLKIIRRKSHYSKGLLFLT